MKIRIDTSILCDPTSLGNIHGYLNVPIAPSIGDKISLFSPLNKVDVKALHFFSASLDVTSVLIVPGNPGEVLCELEVIVVQTLTEARLIAEYLEKGFDLYFDPHEMAVWEGTDPEL